MANWRDVMLARESADDALSAVVAHSDVARHWPREAEALAVLLAARAVCCELRALGTTLTYAADHLNGGE